MGACFSDDNDPYSPPTCNKGHVPAPMNLIEQRRSLSGNSVRTEREYRCFVCDNLEKPICFSDIDLYRVMKKTRERRNSKL